MCKLASMVGVEINQDGVSFSCTSTSPYWLEKRSLGRWREPGPAPIYTGAGRVSFVTRRKGEKEIKRKKIRARQGPLAKSFCARVFALLLCDRSCAEFPTIGIRTRLR